MDDTTRRVNDPAASYSAGGAEGARADEADGAPRTEEIRIEIAQTREEISETIDAIQEKLRPRNIVANATERVKAATTEKVKAMADTAGDTAHTMMERTRETAGGFMNTVRDNPIPAAMIGIGAAWLLSRRSSSSSSSWSATGSSYYGGSHRRASYADSGLYGRRAAGSEWDSGDRGIGQQVSGSAQDVTARAKEYATETGDAIRRTGRRAQNQFQRMMSDNPLLVGAGALLLGAAFGLAVPETERENELMGETRDAVVDRAQELAGDAASKLHDAASTVADAAGGVADATAPRQS